MSAEAKGEPCRRCKGTGIKPGKKRELCASCKGTGYYVPQEPETEGK